MLLICCLETGEWKIAKSILKAAVGKTVNTVRSNGSLQYQYNQLKTWPFLILCQAR